MTSKSTTEPSSRADERVYIFIDGSNLYHVLGEICGRRDLQFDKFAQKLANGRDLRRVYYYNIRQESDRRPELGKDQEKFLASLYDTPYMEVRLGVWRQHGEGMVEKGVDVMLATDLVVKALRDQYETAIIVSGDGDFFPAYQAAKDAGKHVEVAAFDDNLSAEAGRAADLWIKLNKTWFTGLWMPRRGGSEEERIEPRPERRTVQREEQRELEPEKSAPAPARATVGRRRIVRTPVAAVHETVRSEQERQSPAGAPRAMESPVPAPVDTARSEPQPAASTGPARPVIRRTPARRRISATVGQIPVANSSGDADGAAPGRLPPPPLRSAQARARSEQQAAVRRDSPETGQASPEQPVASTEPPSTPTETAGGEDAGGRLTTARRSGWLRRLGLGDTATPSGPTGEN